MSLALNASRAAVEHGQHIFIYCHIRTKQIIYSLDRTLNNHHSLKQISSLGKKSKPPVLRKDFWRPLATVTFPSGHQGLTAYRELRELCKRHEHEWSLEELGVSSNKEAWKKVMDQKANTVADLAAVLDHQAQLAECHQADAAREHELVQSATQQARARIEQIKSEMLEQKPRAMQGSEQAIAQYKSLRNEKMRLRKALEKPRPDFALQHKYHPKNNPESIHQRGPTRTRTRRRGLLPRMSMDGLRIKWADLGDAQYARTWPETVVHDELESFDNRTRHTHPLPEPIATAPSEAEEKTLTEDEAQVRIPPQNASSEVEKVSQEKPMLTRIIERLQYGRQ